MSKWRQWLFGASDGHGRTALPDKRWFGIALYSPRVEDDNAGDWVRAALAEPKGRVCGVQLAQIGPTSTKDNFGKDRLVNEKGLRDVLNRSMQGKVHFIHGFDVELDPHESLSGRDIFYFYMTATRIYSSEVRDLVVSGPEASYDQSAALSYVRKLVTEFPIDYGCIASGLTHFHVDATVRFTYSSHVEDDERLRQYGPDHPRKQFAKEIGFYQSRRRRFSEFVPRACWGSILSAKHIECLGGVDRIVRMSEAYLVERWGENLYVQLTKSLWECTNDDLLRFNCFLEPVRFPDAPIPVYLDPASKGYVKY